MPGTLIWPLLSGLLLLHSANVNAQEGIVTYEEVIKLDIELPPEMEHMRDQFPNSETTMRMLLFNESASLYKNAPDQPETPEHEIFHEEEGNVIRFQTQRSENESYVDLEKQTQIEKRDFLGRTFLVTGGIEPLAWRLTDERSEFLGYMCQKALAIQDSTTYEAWFTPEIPVSTGPGQGGLPGLILMMRIDDGQRSYVAKTMDLSQLEEGAVSPPKKGKKISQKEFDKIVAEKMKEMEMTESGRGTFIHVRRQ